MVVSQETGSGGAGSGAAYGLRLVLGQVVDDVDLTGLELAVHEVDLERIEPERLEHVVQLGLQKRAALLGTPRRGAAGRRSSRGCRCSTATQDPS